MRECIPEPLRPLLEDLDSEVTWLHGRWTIYKQLFTESPERLELLNASAGTFFYVLQWLFLDDVSLSITRLTDPPGAGTRQNAVLGQLLTDSTVSTETTLGDTLRHEMSDLQALVEPFRLIRNKRIAHRDITYALKVEGATLPGISYEAVEAALHQIRKIMNLINVHFCQTETAYELFSMLTDGDGLVYALKRGAAFGEAERQGVVPWDYLDKSRFGSV